MKTCDMALRLKAHTADAAMLFLKERHREERHPTKGRRGCRGLWMREGETEGSIRGKKFRKFGIYKTDLCMFVLLPANNTNQTPDRKTQPVA